MRQRGLAGGGRAGPLTFRLLASCPWLAFGASALLACGGPEPPQAPTGLVEPFPSEPAEPPSTLPLAPKPPILLRGVGFEGPRGAAHDPVEDVYLISSVRGAPGAEDGEGFISRVSPDGALLALEWIAGSAAAPLNAPKGLALVGDTLFVADLTLVRSYDRQSGRALGDVTVEGAVSLDDVAAGPGGVLYVSDSGAATAGARGAASGAQASGGPAVYRIDAARNTSVLARLPAEDAPGALLFDAGRVLVAARSGELYALDEQGQKTVLGRSPGGGLAGLMRTPGGRLVVSSWEARMTYIGPPPPAAPHELEPLITDLTTPGDLAYDAKRRQLIVPLFEEDAVYIQELPGEVQ